MKKSKKKIKAKYDENGSLVRDTRGLSTVEYLILLVVIGVAGISVWKKVGASIVTEATTAKGSIDALN